MSVHHRVLNPLSSHDLPKGLCALAVMTKVPRPGEVKTRLTPPLTPDEAARLNSCFLSDTFNAIASATRDSPASGVAVFTPMSGEKELEAILPAAFKLVAQRGNAFEERLMCAMEDLFSLGFESVCLIDSDSPTVPLNVFSEAVKILLAGDKNTVVLGPSNDGGYYLVGGKALHRRLFQDIEWSTERVLEQTLKQASELRLKIQLLPVWYDIDDEVSLERLCRELFGSNQSEGYAAPATRGYMEELLAGARRKRIWPNEHRHRE
jgi:rSAM/selenodomain-associated transferase 1